MYMSTEDVEKDVNRVIETVVVKHDKGKFTVVLPFCYPDGEFIEIYIDEETLHYTDGGNSVKYLSELNVPLEKIEPVVDRIARENSVRYKNGELMAFSIVMIPNLVNVCFAVAMLRYILEDKATREHLKKVIELIE